MTTWVNGALVADEAAVVSAYDHGLTVGDGVFETLKVVGGVPFAMRRHVERLARSARALGLPEPDAGQVREAVGAVVAADGRDRLRLRITYTGGIAPLGSGRGDSDPTLVVAVSGLAPWPATTAVATVPWTRNERGALAGLKTTSYADNVIALAAAHAVGAEEAVFADTRGRLSEGTGSNVFLVVDGRLLTPTLATGCLAGVTRALLLEWTDAVEEDIPFEALGTAEEVFLTSSTRDVQAVHAVDDHRVPAAPGPVTVEVATTFERRSRENPDP
ncbi:MAG TPA: aminotransferase class IV [Jiangellales bacterium]|nr:aminotransferase class IV [Jiangellales bacterium]